MHAVEKIVAQALARVGVERGELVLVALSGGPDSVALLRALIALKPDLRLRLCAAHFNHRLRAEESERDETFVRGLCEQLAVPLAVEAASGLSAGAPNLEERARALRLDFLHRAAALRGATRIALGHNRDDQAETILMRLLRGAGTAGLKGMAPAGPGRLVRPLLGASRREILSYLAALGAAWMADSSNRSPARLRNRIRHELIPLLEARYASGLSRRLSALGVEMEHLDRLVTQLARREMARRLVGLATLDAGSLGARGPGNRDLGDLDFCAATAAAGDISGLELGGLPAGEHGAREAGLGGLRIDGLERLPAALISALIREFIARRAGSLRRVGRAHIDAIVRLCLAGPPNGRVSLPGRLNLRREYDRIVIERAAAGSPAISAFDVPIIAPGVTLVEPAAMRFDAELALAEGAYLPPTQDEAWFDAREAGAGLRVRNFRPGDRITLTAGASSRKLKELFQERRVPRPQRATFPVVTLDGEIVWLPGIARSGRALVNADSEMVLKLRADSLIARRQRPVLALS